ncbi:MAG: carbohydrate kinase family protein [Candidatus Moranbacteria bacterium]|nr:carbohydrate kinase family protein [Candidatus Moranbacteria bacterium]
MFVLVSGSLVYDHIMDFPDRFKNHILPDNIHILNVCFTVNKLGKSKGGTAGNIGYNLKLLGAEPFIVSSVGSDGDEYLKYLVDIGASINLIKKEKKLFTASCFITTDQDDNQITAFYNGALGSAPDVFFKRRDKKPKWAIVSPTQKEIMIKHLSQCATLGIKVIFDPGQQIPAFSDKELKKSISRADVLIGNDYEIKMIQKRTGWSGKEILNKTKMLITTFGDKGSFIKTNQKEEILVEASRPKKIVDPTGAGDAYRAGLLIGLDKGYNLRMCGRIGSVAASFAIEKYGTQEHKFSKKEFEKRYDLSYGEKIDLAD